MIAPSSVSTLVSLAAQLPERNWACWRRIPRTNGKFSKPPFHPLSGRMADVADPGTWSSFDECLTTAQSGPFEGIALMLAEGITGIDFDDVIPAGATSTVRKGDLSPLPAWAREIIALTASYTEISVSGGGLHILVRAALPAGSSNRTAHFEIYDQLRCLALTGDHVVGTPLTVAARQTEIDAIVARILPARTPVVVASPPTCRTTLSRSDNEVLAKARGAKNGAKFSRLYDHGAADGDDHSALDLALCRMLAYWCNYDAAQVDRLYRASKLMRPKWDARHGVRAYGVNTIALALSLR